METYLLHKQLKSLRHGVAHTHGDILDLLAVRLVEWTLDLLGGYSSRHHAVAPGLDGVQKGDSGGVLAGPGLELLIDFTLEGAEFGELVEDGVDVSGEGDGCAQGHEVEGEGQGEDVQDGLEEHLDGCCW